MGLSCFPSPGLFSEILTDLITVKKAQNLCKILPQSDPTIHLLVTNAVAVTTGSRTLSETGSLCSLLIRKEIILLPCFERWSKPLQVCRRCCPFYCCHGFLCSMSHYHMCQLSPLEPGLAFSISLYSIQHNWPAVQMTLQNVHMEHESSPASGRAVPYPGRNT